MNEPISIKEILAVVLKRGKLIICCCLVLAILAGAYEVFTQWRTTPGIHMTDEEIELIYQTELEAYTNQKSALEAELISMQDYLQAHQNYVATSLLMKLDATYRPTSQMCFAVNNLVYGEQWNQLIERKEDMIPHLADQYVSLWRSIDLTQELKNHPYTNLTDAELRELVSISYMADTGYIMVRADADTSEGSRQLCNAAYAYLLRANQIVLNNGYTHTLDLVSDVDMFFDDPSLWEKQVWRQNEIKNAQENCDELQLALAELVVPTKLDPQFCLSIPGVVKWCVIGAVLGVLLACIVILAKFIIMDNLENSRQMAALVAAPYLGSVAAVTGFWNRLALTFTGEAFWTDAEEGRRYIAENVAARMPEKTTIALLSTLGNGEDAANIQAAIQTLREQGHTVRYVNKAHCNPDTMRAIRECETVLFAEAAGKSSRVPVMNVKEQVLQLEGKIKGFLFV